MSKLNVFRNSAEEHALDNGLERGDRKELAKSLSRNLANSYILYLKTQNAHWNLVGPLFYSVHKLSEEQYNDLAVAIDEIAERIRAIGFLAPGSFSQMTDLASLKEENTHSDANTIISQLVEANETCAKEFRIAVDQAERAEDVKTADLLTARIGQHEENAWMLRSLIS